MRSRWSDSTSPGIRGDLEKRLPAFLGRRAVVTGGSQGVGLESSKLLAQCGAQVAIVFLRSADVDNSAAETALHEVARFGTKVLLIEADVTNAGDVDRIATGWSPSGAALTSWSMVLAVSRPLRNL